MSGYGREGEYGQQGGYGGNQGGYGGDQGGYGGDQGGYGRQQGYGEQQAYGGGGQGEYGRQEGGYGGEEERRGEGHHHGHHGGFGGGNAPQGGSYGGGGGYGGSGDFGGAMSHAEQHGGDSADSSMFSNVLGRLGQNQQNIGNQQIDEQHAVQSHQQFFGGGGGGGEASTGAMGSAAAMQALKMFTGGQSGNTHEGNSQNAFIGMAMGQASKLFDQQSASGNVAAGASKENVIQHAAESALQMYMQSQGGSGGSGGMSGLMGLASKFM